MTFFENKKGAAELKHAILERYVRIYFSKTGSTSAGHRGVYLDGYAGPGTYDDDTPGSPRIAVEALSPLAHVRNVELIFIEKKRSTYEELSTLCSTAAFEGAIALHGKVEKHVDAILQRAAGLPLFAFFDPFGMGLPLEVLQRVLNRPTRGRRRPTEVLLNVSLSGIYRNAGKLDSKATVEKTRKAHARTVERMDAHVGGDWWRDVWRSGAEDRTEQIAREYITRIAPGWGTYSVPVSVNWRTPPKYFLVLLTRHQDGLWLFNNSVSGALEQFHAFCHSEGQQSLEDPELQAPAWVDLIERNVSQILTGSGEFVIIDRLTDVLGDALGYARETHIRSALRRMYPSQIADPPKGDLEKFRVRPTGQFSLL
jgi:three-Cys-motif partner protein